VAKLDRPWQESMSGQLESGAVALSSAVQNPIPTPTGTDPTRRTIATLCPISRC
jgi:hypothetical protein